MMRRIGCPGTPRYAAATRRRLRAARITFHAKFLAMVPAMLLMAACQSYVQQQEVQHKVDVEQDHLRLMVYTSDLTEPYEKLGDLSYSDPLNGETIDTDHINEKLRQMAIERWGQQVDAIILVTTKVGGADTSTISVAGEAVRIKGPCAGCRHNYSAPRA
jgi:N-acetylglutamate synthase/N-acetylornithine aminotransferase